MPAVIVNGWTPEEWAEIQREAERRGMSAKRYIVYAVREKLMDVPDVMEPIYSITRGEKDHAR